MLMACRTTYDVFSELDESFQVDRSFLETILKEDPTALVHISEDAQRLYPEMVVELLVPFCSDSMASENMNALANHLVPSFWEDRAFVLKYFEAGLPFAEMVFPTEWKNDSEIFLRVAKHCRKDLRRASFSKASVSLRGCKDFMLMVVLHDNSLVACATSSLQQDYDVLLKAFAGPQDAVEYCLDHPDWDGYARIPYVNAKMTRELEVHKTFCSTVLYGISDCSVATGTGDAPTLSVLDQGAETSVTYKMLIAEYLEVPAGKRPRLLRQAHKNLTEAMKDWVRR